MKIIAGVIAGVSITIAQSQVQAFNLYDGSHNTTLTAQGWTQISPPGSVTVSNGGTVLTTTNSQQGGFSISRTLDRSKGYTLGFNFQLLSETHLNLNRAGFSVIVLSSDRQGIELGFWGSDLQLSDRIWAQSDGDTKPPRFTRAEGTPFNPIQAIVRYDLAIKDNTYRLFANQNFQAPILTGSLRNYMPEGLPYTLANFIFMGDNTTSAGAAVKITQVDLINAALTATPTPNAVPEPFTVLGGATAIAIGRLMQRKRRRLENRQNI